MSSGGEFLAERIDLRSALKKDLYQAVCQIASAVAAQNFEVCLVGGAVRDIVSGKTPEDVDLVTTASPEEMAGIFPEVKLTGVSFGVMRLRAGGYEFEIATARKERNYMDGRHPENIQYTRNLDEDAERRDFTFNAMRLDPLTGKLYDPAGGVADLKRGILRTVGEPEVRFKEDYLRMIRAVRFAARFNFVIEENTLAAIKKLSACCAELSGERIREEMTRILTGKNPAYALQLLFDTGILAAVLPEAARMSGVTQPEQFHPEGDVFEHTLLMLRHMAYPDPLLAWSVLLHDVGKPETRSVEPGGRIRFFCHEERGAEIAGRIADRLHFSNDDKEAVVNAVRGHMRMAHVPEMKKAKLRKLMAGKHFAMEMELNRLDCFCSNKLMQSFLFLCDELHKDSGKSLLALPEPWVRGRDLVAAGFSPCPAFKKVLDTVFDQQLADEFANPQAALTWAIGAMKKHGKTAAPAGNVADL